MYFLATEVFVPPLQGPEQDILNALIASVVMSVVRFVGNFRRRAEAAPMIPGSGWERNFVPLIQQLIEQGNRLTPPPGLSLDEPMPGGAGINDMSDTEVFSDNGSEGDDDHIW